MKKHAGKIVAIVVLLAVVGFVVYRSLPKTETTANSSRSVTVAVGDIKPIITATGYISAASQTSVNFAASGKLVEVNVKAGDRVAAGDILGKIDPTDLQRLVDQAQSNLESTEIKRSQVLANDDTNIESNQLSVDTAKRTLDSALAKLADLKTKYPAPNDAQQREIDQQQSAVDQADTSYKQALIRLGTATDAKGYDERLQDIQLAQSRQSLDDAEENFEEAILTASVAGTVISVSGSVGDQVGNSQTSSTTRQMSSTNGSGGSSGGSSSGGSSSGGSSSSGSSGSFVVIGDPTKTEVTLTIDQSDITKVQVDMAVETTVDALPDRVFKGKITTVNPTPSTSSGVTTFTVYASIDNSDQALRQGMSCSASIIEGVKKNVLIVPNMAIRAASSGRVVQKMIDGQLTEIKVVIGASDEQYTEVKSGLLEGDEISVDVFRATSSGAQQTGGRSGMGIPGMGGGRGAGSGAGAFHAD